MSLVTALVTRVFERQSIEVFESALVAKAATSGTEIATTIFGLLVHRATSMAGPSPSETEIPFMDEPVPATTPRPSSLVIWLWRQSKRVVVFVIGSTVLVIGIVMIVAPGPAIIVIPLGLSILATEFVWARRWLDYAKRQFEQLSSRNLKPPN